MAKNHFASEKPGRINISIPGYDPAGNLKAQASKRAEKWRREQRRAAASAASAKPKDTQVSAAPPSDPTQPQAEVEAEIDAMVSAASKPRSAFDLELAAAFHGGAEGEGRHAHE